MKDLSSDIKLINHLPVVAADADAEALPAAPIDRKGFEGVTFILETGAGGITFDGTNKIEWILEHGDADDALSAVESKDVIGAETDTITGGIVLTFDEARAANVYKIAYTGGKRYVRLRGDFSGTHGAATTVSITAVLSHGHITVGYDA